MCHESRRKHMRHIYDIWWIHILSYCITQWNHPFDTYMSKWQQKSSSNSTCRWLCAFLLTVSALLLPIYAIHFPSSAICSATVKISNGLLRSTSFEHSLFHGCNEISLLCNTTRHNAFILTCDDGFISFRKLAYMCEIKCFSSLLSAPGLTKTCSVSPDWKGCYGGLFCNITARLLHVAARSGSMEGHNN